MIILASSLFGILLGVLTARRRGGNRKDMAQYGAGFGIAFFLLGMLVTLIIARNFL